MKALATGLVCLLLAACQPTSSWKQDEAAMLALLQEAADAFNRGDLPGHLASYAEDVTFMTKSGPRTGVAPIEKAFREIYFADGKPKQQLRFEQFSARALDDDAALVTGRFILSGGDLPEQTGWFTTVWVRSAAGWKIVHDHSS